MNEIKYKRLMWTFVIFMILSIVLNVYYFFENKKIKENQKQAQSELSDINFNQYACQMNSNSFFGTIKEINESKLLIENEYGIIKEYVRNDVTAIQIEKEGVFEDVSAEDLKVGSNVWTFVDYVSTENNLITMIKIISNE